MKLTPKGDKLKAFKKGFVKFENKSSKTPLSKFEKISFNGNKIEMQDNNLKYPLLYGKGIISLELHDSQFEGIKSSYTGESILFENDLSLESLSLKNSTIRDIDTKMVFIPAKNVILRDSVFEDIRGSVFKNSVIESFKASNVSFSSI